MTQGMPSEWQVLSDSAAAGDLYLDPDVALRCAAHCSTFIGQLEQLRESAVSLRDIDGLGTFPSGLALAHKFSLKAHGGSYSLDQALEDHIAVVTDMRDVFTRIHAMYATTEDDNTAALNATG